MQFRLQADEVLDRSLRRKAHCGVVAITRHDVVESRELGRDPGDRALLEWAANESRILITIDTDFGQLIFLESISHYGLVRLPDVPAEKRIQIMEDLLARFSAHLEQAAVITVRGGRVRISRSKPITS